MKHRLYLRVEGHGIDLPSFASSIHRYISGSIGRRRHSGAPLAAVPIDYWMSNEVRIEQGFPEEALLDLIRPFREALLAGLIEQPIDVTAVIVAEYGEEEGPVGYFFSEELISTLSAIRAKLEIDAVPDMSGVSPS